MLARLPLAVALAVGVPFAAARGASATGVVGEAGAARATAVFAVKVRDDAGQHLPKPSCDCDGELARLRQEVEALRFELQRARGWEFQDAFDTVMLSANETAVAREENGERSALDAGGVNSDNPVVVRIDALPHQKAVAIAAAVFGGFGVVGPSSYVRFFLALSGSAVGGLMVASCYSFIAEPPADDMWLGSVFMLLKVEGLLHKHFHAYLLWGSFLALGVLRWLTRWECGFYDVVDEVQMGPDGRPTVTALLRKPLLPPLPPPPPAGLTVMRDEV